MPLLTITDFKNENEIDDNNNNETDNNKFVVVISSRIHPGESNASWVL